MLVFGFTGAIGDDLDTNDDGVLDTTPWTSVLQTIAFVESAVIPPVGTEYVYGNVRVGPDVGGFVPSQLAYCPSAAIWTIGPFDPVLTPGFDSPGAANPSCDYTNPCPADFDGSGAVGSPEYQRVDDGLDSGSPSLGQQAATRWRSWLREKPIKRLGRARGAPLQNMGLPHEMWRVVKRV